MVIPDAVVSVWAELFDHSKYEITMQLFCTKLQKKDMFGCKVCIPIQGDSTTVEYHTMGNVWQR